MIEARTVNPYQGRKTEQPEYDKRQLSKYLRENNEIKAYQILKTEGKKVTIQLPTIFNGETSTFDMGEKFDAEHHVPGNYIDLIIGYTVYKGEAPSSYHLTYVGFTPQEFIPTAGEIG